VKYNFNTDSGELSVLMCGASVFSHLLLDRQKGEYLWSFLEVVPRLVNRQSSQPVFRCLLKLAVVVVVVAVVVVAVAAVVFVAVAVVVVVAVAVAAVVVVVFAVVAVVVIVVVVVVVVEPLLLPPRNTPQIR
jgi:O-antigen ligase